MFTGIVEEIGRVERIKHGQHSAVLTIHADTVLEGTKIGDSIAVNGICLTVTELFSHGFSADVMHETLNRSSLAGLTMGTPVNLERAMAAVWERLSACVGMIQPFGIPYRRRRS